MSGIININTSNGLYVNVANGTASYTSNSGTPSTITISFAQGTDGYNVPNNFSFNIAESGVSGQTNASLSTQYTANTYSTITISIFSGYDTTNYKLQYFITGLLLQPVKNYRDVDVNTGIVFDTEAQNIVIKFRLVEINNNVNITVTNSDNSLPRNGFNYMVSNTGTGNDGSYNPGIGQIHEVAPYANVTFSNFGDSSNTWDKSTHKLQYRYYNGSTSSNGYDFADDSIVVTTENQDLTLDFKLVQCYSIAICSANDKIVSAKVTYTNLNNVETEVNLSSGDRVNYVVGIKPNTSVIINNFGTTPGYIVTGYSFIEGGQPTLIQNGIITIGSISSDCNVYLTTAPMTCIVTLHNASNKSIIYTYNSNETTLGPDNSGTITDVAFNSVINIRLSTESGFRVSSYTIDNETTTIAAGQNSINLRVKENITVHLNVTEYVHTVTLRNISNKTISYKYGGTSTQILSNASSSIQNVSDRSSITITELSTENGFKVITATEGIQIANDNSITINSVTEDITIRLNVEAILQSQPPVLECHIDKQNLDVYQLEYANIKIIPNGAFYDSNNVVIEDDLDNISSNFSSVSNNYTIKTNTTFYICIKPEKDSNTQPPILPEDIARNNCLQINYGCKPNYCTVEEVQNDDQFLYKLAVQFNDSYTKQPYLVVDVNYISTDIAKYYKINNVYTNLFNDNDHNIVANNIINRTFSSATPILLDLSKLINKGYELDSVKCCWTNNNSIEKPCTYSMKTNTECSFVLSAFEENNNTFSNPTKIDVYFKFKSTYPTKKIDLINDAYLKQPEYTIKVQYSKSEPIHLVWKPKVYSKK